MSVREVNNDQLCFISAITQTYSPLKYILRSELERK